MSSRLAFLGLALAVVIGWLRFHFIGNYQASDSSSPVLLEFPQSSLAGIGKQVALDAVLRLLDRRGALSYGQINAALMKLLGVQYHLVGANRYLGDWLSDCDQIHHRPDGRFQLKQQPSVRQPYVPERPFSFASPLVGGRR